MTTATTKPLHIAKLVVIGVGLIGGSVARALRAAGVVDSVHGLGRTQDSLQQAKALGVIDAYFDDYRSALADADVVLVATPVGAKASVFRALAPVLPKHTVVTDAGSVKGRVLSDAESALGTAFPRFIGAHPIAGTEHSGVAAADAKLFRRRLTVLTPSAQSESTAVALVRAFWEATGSTVLTMEAAAHDQMLAATSHLPHMVAYALVAQLGARLSPTDLAQFSAGGLSDFTRIAASDADMWADICCANREALVAMMEDYGESVARLTAMVRAGDRAGLHALFSDCRAQRRAWRSTQDRA